MSKHTFSAFTSDICKNPSILQGLVDTASARTHFEADINIEDKDGVTTVTAVAA